MGVYSSAVPTDILKRAGLRHMQTAIKIPDLYAGIEQSPGKIFKVDFETFSIVDSLTLSSGEDYVFALEHDGTYLYAGLSTDPAKIVRVRLSDLSRVDALTLLSGENRVSDLLRIGTKLYASLFITDPAVVAKIDLPTLTREAIVTAPTGNFYSGNLATLEDFLYEGIEYGSLAPSYPSCVAKINLQTFTIDSILHLDADDRYINESGRSNQGSLIKDSFYYTQISVGTRNRIVKVDLTTFTRVGMIEYDPIGNIRPESLLAVDNYLYCGTRHTDAHVLKIDLATFTEVDRIELPVDNNVFSLQAYKGFLYAGLNETPGVIYKIRLSDFTIMDSLTFPTDQGPIICMDIA